MMARNQIGDNAPTQITRFPGGIKRSSTGVIDTTRRFDMRIRLITGGLADIALKISAIFTQIVP